jgi:hypothetical protein
MKRFLNFDLAWIILSLVWIFMMIGRIIAPDSPPTINNCVVLTMWSMVLGMRIVMYLEKIIES